MTTRSRTIVLQARAAVALQRSASVYRQEPRLGPPTLSQTIHLQAARRLNVGPTPPVKGAEAHPLRSGLGGLVDVMGFWLLRHLFSGTHRAEVEAADYYELEDGWLERSETATLQAGWFFAAPPAPRPERRWRQTMADGGSVEDLCFASDYAPHRSSALRMLRQYPDNARALARCYRHPGPGHPAVMWLHGWGMGFHSVEAVVSKARWLYGQGLDVYLVVLPYHAQRRPPGVGFAGSVFPTTNMTRTNEGFVQSVWEIRSLMAWHRQQGGGPCGVMGLSLGAYMAAVLASVVPETAFAVCLLPVADIPTLMWSNGQGTPERRQAEEAGVTFEMFCRSMAVHAPLARPAAIPTERIMLVGARGDRIIPPLHTEALWEHWGRPRLHWIPGSHLVHFGRGGYLHQVEAFLQETGIPRP